MHKRRLRAQTRAFYILKSYEKYENNKSKQNNMMDFEYKGVRHTISFQIQKWNFHWK